MADTPESQGDASGRDPETQDAGEMAERALGSAQDAVNDLKGDAERKDAERESQPTEPTAEGEVSGTDDSAGDAQAGAEAEGEQPAAGPNVELPSFQKVLADVEASGLDLLHDVDLNVKIELGRTHMLVEDVLRLGSGSVVELDKLAGDPVDVYVNDRLVARGEVLVLSDNFCVRISEIVADIEDEDNQGEDAAKDVATVNPSAASAAARSTGG